jgi:hypothetical protein
MKAQKPGSPQQEAGVFDVALEEEEAAEEHGAEELAEVGCNLEVTADRLTLWARQSAAARNESAATDLASLVAIAAAEAAAARSGFKASPSERVPIVDA